MSDPIALPTLFTAEPAPRTKTSGAADTAAGVVLWVLLLGTAYAAAMFAGFYAMAADGCPPGPCAASDAAGAAILLQWVGIAAIVVGTAVITVVQARRRRYTFHWPLIGIGLVVLCTVVTGGMANAAMSQ
ncbi:hypothetical protein [Tsukamurella paurometabola]|uniref:Integral membrane protein n=1 Tax=Tsukamurella paurometabola TaxID=2061 RepID=A0A3P8MD45_TSUPA|nr:hypothetical protein [Tsukamurella paurometabola]UEA82880.1 hypothetical protein LK411_21375 [Tsukamurella paurometabola]VDR39956.1 Uncharacterised protein [Tsukamurella paurometabola]